MCVFKVEDDSDGNASDTSASPVDLSLSGESSSRQSIRKKNKAVVVVKY